MCVVCKVNVCIVCKVNVCIVCNCLACKCVLIMCLNTGTVLNWDKIPVTVSCHG